MLGPCPHPWFRLCARISPPFTRPRCRLPSASAVAMSRCPGLPITTIVGVPVAWSILFQVSISLVGAPVHVVEQGGTEQSREGYIVAYLACTTPHVPRIPRSTTALIDRGPHGHGHPRPPVRIVRVMIPPDHEVIPVPLRWLLAERHRCCSADESRSSIEISSALLNQDQRARQDGVAYIDLNQPTRPTQPSQQTSPFSHKEGVVCACLCVCVCE